MIRQERLTFKQIPMLGGTGIVPSTAKMEKWLTYRYILPWTTLRRQKKTIIGRQVDSLGELVAAGRKW